MGRVLPAIGLYFLSPLVGEFLLGNIPITARISLPALLAASLLYGGGALLIREVVRRAGYGWPTMIMFALAYGVIEESFATMTLFNPHWQGHSVLDYGYISAVGISPPWTLFVLGLHTIWSISVPIAIIETLAGSHRQTPWLGNIGLSIAIVLYVLGILVVLLDSISKGFVVSVSQFVGAGIATIVIVVSGILLGRLRLASRTGRAPAPWLVGIVSLVAGSLFLLIYAADPGGLSGWLAGINLPPWLAVVLYLVLFIGMSVLVSYWSHFPDWSQAHHLALAGGALLAYAWHAFPWASLIPGIDNVVDLASNTILAIGAIVLLMFAALQLKKEKSKEAM